MYDRYSDLSKFITDPEKLEVTDDVVYISGEKDYNIAVDIEGCYGSFEEMKLFIAFLGSHICELDNLVQRFDRRKRIKSYVPLPSKPGWTRFDYSSFENAPKEEKKEFPFDLTLIFIEEPNMVTFDYWCTNANSQFDTVFEYNNGKFFLRKFGAFENIPDDWDS